MIAKSKIFKILVGLILLFAGLDVTILLSHTSRVIGILLILAGIAILWLSSEKAEEEILEEKTLATRLINFLTIRGKLKPILPLFGSCVISIIFIYNFELYGSISLGSHDYATLLLGISLLSYNYIPKKFAKERDFAFLFLFFLFLILVLPITLYTIRHGSLKEDVNWPWIYYLLAKPTEGMLRIIGIQATAFEWSGGVYTPVDEYLKSGVYLKIISKNMSKEVFSIGLSCTGLYSVSIFISAFIAFILIEYGKFDWKVGFLLTLGIITSWFANILRMTVIGIFTYYNGTGTEHNPAPWTGVWVHNYIGIFIFMIWVGLFWGIMFKFLIPKKTEEKKKPEVQVEPENEWYCANCGLKIEEPLPSSCPSCGQKFEILENESANLHD